MPTPVKNAFPAAAPPPAKPGRGVYADGAGGEAFRDELVRRGDDRAKTEAAKPQALKAEPKPLSKSKKALRGERGEPMPAAEEPEVRATVEGRAGAEPAAEVEAESEVGTVGASDSAADEADDGPGADETEVDPTPGAALGTVLAPSPPPAAQTDDVAESGAEGHGAADEALDATAVTAGPLPTRPTVYPAQGPAGAGEVPDPTGDESGAPAVSADGAAGLFAEASATAAEGESESGQEQGARDPSAGAAGEEIATSDGAAETPAQFEVRGSAGDGLSAGGGHASPDGFTAAATAGVGEMKTGVRPAGAVSPAGLVAPALPPEARFAAANHETIVTSMRGELLPNGGSMRIRLDPPQLGALQVTVLIQDGVVTASFETSNDEATRLLGHSLNQLKTVLESHGVAVDKLQVQQAPREAQAHQPHDDGRREQGSQSQEQEQSARQEQQRREMLKRMWRRLSGGQDPLDLTA